ncbi:TetR/AcrR family transcriptional regulator [Salisediminibacterium selenitireducens]|uniref:Transcriptional regulator, TetR family n=1 Tax=Bacillus selenitireducens (strain ATCC 700615 / DSM 15326 / MLS10) TaxID=439292 RepID=D6XSL2_BACIE|nr:TetR/AcrR family transcriptional regulator [Salisediminibacterium selenitireducens]ADH98798.1 transcriptional regulator, TetR family [[Bacillus] selenitireducens MLS10]
MNEAFFNLQSDKRKRIINAAMQEFVANGYTSASTNTIVKDAGISKGSLFHYFSNKKDLYLFLIDHTNIVIQDVYEAIDLEEPDLFKRLSKIGFAKMKIQQQYPQTFDFLTSVLNEPAEDVRQFAGEKLAAMQESGFNQLYVNVDWSLFKDTINVEKATEILNWTMMGFSEKYRNKLATFKDVGPELLEEWEDYAAILKNSYYKDHSQRRNGDESH